MNPLMLYASIAVMLAGFASGWAVRDWKADADALAALQAAERLRVEMQNRADSKSDEYERLRAGLEPSRVEVRNNIREIYRNVEVPAECAADDAAVGLLDATRRNANASASGEPRRELLPDPGSAKSAD